MGELLLLFADRIENTAAMPIMAHTHIQPAEPSTLGYRYAIYAQDLFEDWRRLTSLVNDLRGKGFKGAVGTQASFQEIFKNTEMSVMEMEEQVMDLLDLPYYPIATQTYTRQQDLHILQALAGIASSLHKFALDFRVLQSPPFGEWSTSANRKFIDEINAANADVLWVGMTAPKQEKWVFQNRRDINVPVIGSIGAVFDFYAGTVSAAPEFVRMVGLEAVYRLLKEEDPS